MNADKKEHENFGQEKLYYRNEKSNQLWVHSHGKGYSSITDILPSKFRYSIFDNNLLTHKKKGTQSTHSQSRKGILPQGQTTHFSQQVRST